MSMIGEEREPIGPRPLALSALEAEFRGLIGGSTAAQAQATTLGPIADKVKKIASALEILAGDLRVSGVQDYEHLRNIARDIESAARVGCEELIQRRKKELSRLEIMLGTFRTTDYGRPQKPPVQESLARAHALNRNMPNAGD